MPFRKKELFMEQKDFVEVNLATRNATDVVPENDAAGEANVAEPVVNESVVENTEAETVEYVFGNSSDDLNGAERESGKGRKAKSGDAKKKRNWRVGIISLLTAIVIAALVCGLIFRFQKPDTPVDPVETKISIFEKQLSEYKLASDYVLTKEDFDCIGTDIGKMALNGEICIDLNGKVLDLGGYDLSILAEESGATVTFKNGTVKNGTLNISTKDTKIIREKVKFESSCKCNFSKYSIFQNRQDTYVLPYGKTYTLDEDDMTYIKDISKNNTMLLNYPCKIDINNGKFDLGGYEFDIVSLNSSSKLIAFENGTITNGTLRVQTEATDVKVNSVTFTETCDYFFDTKKAEIAFLSLSAPLSSERFSSVGGTIRLSNTVVSDALVLKSNLIAEKNSSVKALIVSAEDETQEKIKIALSETQVLESLTIQKDVDIAGVVDCPISIEEKATLNVLKDTSAITGETEEEKKTETKLKVVTVNSEAATLVQANLSTIEAVKVEKAGNVTLGGKVNALTVNDKANINVRYCSIVDEVKINDHAKVEFNGTAAKVVINSESTVTFNTQSYVQDLNVGENAGNSKVTINGQAAVVSVEGKNATVDVKGDAKISVVIDKTENEISKISYSQRAQVVEKLTGKEGSTDDKQDEAKKDFVMPIYYKESECSDGTEEDNEKKKGSIIYKEGGEYTADGETTESELAAKDHIYTYNVVVYPTNTKTGLGRYTCVDCGDHFDEEIPMREVVVFDIESIMQVLGVVLKDDTIAYNLDDNTKFLLEYQKVNEVIEEIRQFLLGETAQGIAEKINLTDMVNSFAETLEGKMLTDEECALFLIREAGINMTVKDGLIYGSACLDVAFFTELASEAAANLSTLTNDDALLSLYIKVYCKGEKAYVKYDIRVIDAEGKTIHETSENIGEVQKAIDKLMLDSGLGFTLTDAIGIYNTIATTVAIIDSYKLSFQKYKEYATGAMAQVIITKDPEYLIKEEAEDYTKYSVDFEKLFDYVTKVGRSTVGELIDEALGIDATDTLFTLAEKIPEMNLGEIVDTVMLAANEFAIDEESLYGDINLLLDSFINDVPYDLIEKGLAAKVAENAQLYFGKEEGEEGAEYDIRRALDEYEYNTIYELIFGKAPVYDYNDEMKKKYATEKDYSVAFYGSQEYKDYYNKKQEIIGGNQTVEGKVVFVGGKYQDVLNTYQVSMDASVKEIFDDVYTSVYEILLALEDIDGEVLQEYVGKIESEAVRTVLEPVVETLTPALVTINTFLSTVAQELPDYKDEEGNVEAYEGITDFFKGYIESLSCSWVKQADGTMTAFKVGFDIEKIALNVTVDSDIVNVSIATEYGDVLVKVGDNVVVGFDCDVFGIEIAVNNEGFEYFNLKKLVTEYGTLTLNVGDKMLKELTITDFAFEDYAGGIQIINNELVTAVFTSPYGNLDVLKEGDFIRKLEADVNIASIGETKIGLTGKASVVDNVLKELKINGAPVDFTMDDEEWTLAVNYDLNNGGKIALNSDGLNTLEEINAALKYSRKETERTENIGGKEYAENKQKEAVLNFRYAVDEELTIDAKHTETTDVVYVNAETDKEYNASEDKNAKHEVVENYVFADRTVTLGQIESNLNFGYAGIVLATDFTKDIEAVETASGSLVMDEKNVLTYTYAKNREKIDADVVYYTRNETEDVYTLKIEGDDIKVTTTANAAGANVVYDYYYDGGMGFAIEYQDYIVEVANYVGSVDDVKQKINIAIPEYGTLYYMKDEEGTYVANVDAFGVLLESQFGKETVFNLAYDEMFDIEFAKGDEDMVGHAEFAGTVVLDLEGGDGFDFTITVLDENTGNVTYSSKEEFSFTVSAMGYEIAVENEKGMLTVEVYDENNDALTFTMNGGEYYAQLILTDKFAGEFRYGEEILVDMTVEGMGSIYFDKTDDNLQAEITYKDLIEFAYDNGAHDMNVVMEDTYEIHVFHKGEILNVTAEALDMFTFDIFKTSEKISADVNFDYTYDGTFKINLEGLYEEANDKAHGSLILEGFSDFEYDKDGVKEVYALTVLDSIKPFLTVTKDDGEWDILFEKGNIIDNEEQYEDVQIEVFLGKEEYMVRFANESYALKVRKLEEGHIVSLSLLEGALDIAYNGVETTLAVDYKKDDIDVNFDMKTTEMTIVFSYATIVSLDLDILEDNVIVGISLFDNAAEGTFNYKAESFRIAGEKKNARLSDEVTTDIKGSLECSHKDIEISASVARYADVTFSKKGDEYKADIDVLDGNYTFEFEYGNNGLKIDLALGFEENNFGFHYYDTAEKFSVGAAYGYFAVSLEKEDDLYTAEVSYVVEKDAVTSAIMNGVRTTVTYSEGDGVDVDFEAHIYSNGILDLDSTFHFNQKEKKAEANTEFVINGNLLELGIVRIVVDFLYEKDYGFVLDVVYDKDTAFEAKKVERDSCLTIKALDGEYRFSLYIDEAHTVDFGFKVYETTLWKDFAAKISKEHFVEILKEFIMIRDDVTAKAFVDDVLASIAELWFVDQTFESYYDAFQSIGLEYFYSSFKFVFKYDSFVMPMVSSFTYDNKEGKIVFEMSYSPEGAEQTVVLTYEIDYSDLTVKPNGKLNGEVRFKNYMKLYATDPDTGDLIYYVMPESFYGVQFNNVEDELTGEVLGVAITSCYYEFNEYISTEEPEEDEELVAMDGGYILAKWIYADNQFIFDKFSTYNYAQEKVVDLEQEVKITIRGDGVYELLNYRNMNFDVVPLDPDMVLTVKSYYGPDKIDMDFKEYIRVDNTGEASYLNPRFLLYYDADTFHVESFGRDELSINGFKYIFAPTYAIIDMTIDDSQAQSGVVKKTLTATEYTWHGDQLSDFLRYYPIGQYRNDFGADKTISEYFAYLDNLIVEKKYMTDNVNNFCCTYSYEDYRLNYWTMYDEGTIDSNGNHISVHYNDNNVVGMLKKNGGDTDVLINTKTSSLTDDSVQAFERFTEGYHNLKKSYKFTEDDKIMYYGVNTSSMPYSATYLEMQGRNLFEKTMQFDCMKDYETKESGIFFLTKGYTYIGSDLTLSLYNQQELLYGVAAFFGYASDEMDLFYDNLKVISDTLLENPEQASMQTIAKRCSYQGGFLTTEYGCFIFPYMAVKGDYTNYVCLIFDEDGDVSLWVKNLLHFRCCYAGGLPGYQNSYLYGFDNMFNTGLDYMDYIEYATSNAVKGNSSWNKILYSWENMADFYCDKLGLSTVTVEKDNAVYHLVDNNLFNMTDEEIASLEVTDETGMKSSERYGEFKGIQTYFQNVLLGNAGITDGDYGIRTKLFTSEMSKAGQDFVNGLMNNLGKKYPGANRGYGYTQFAAIGLDHPYLLTMAESKQITTYDKYIEALAKVLGFENSDAFLAKWNVITGMLSEKSGDLKARYYKELKDVLYCGRNTYDNGNIYMIPYYIVNEETKENLFVVFYYEKLDKEYNDNVCQAVFVSNLNNLLSLGGVPFGEEEEVEQVTEKPVYTILGKEYICSDIQSTWELEFLDKYYEEVGEQDYLDGKINGLQEVVIIQITQEAQKTSYGISSNVVGKEYALDGRRESDRVMNKNAGFTIWDNEEGYVEGLSFAIFYKNDNIDYWDWEHDDESVVLSGMIRYEEDEHGVGAIYVGALNWAFEENEQGEEEYLFSARIIPHFDAETMTGDFEIGLDLHFYESTQVGYDYIRTQRFYSYEEKDYNLRGSGSLKEFEGQYGREFSLQLDEQEFLNLNGEDLINVKVQIPNGNVKDFALKAMVKVPVFDAEADGLTYQERNFGVDYQFDKESSKVSGFFDTYEVGAGYTWTDEVRTANAFGSKDGVNVVDVVFHGAIDTPEESYYGISIKHPGRDESYYEVEETEEESEEETEEETEEESEEESEEEKTEDQRKYFYTWAPINGSVKLFVPCTDSMKIRLTVDADEFFYRKEENILVETNPQGDYFAFEPIHIDMGIAYDEESNVHTVYATMEKAAEFTTSSYILTKVEGTDDTAETVKENETLVLSAFNLNGTLMLELLGENYLIVNGTVPNSDYNILDNGSKGGNKSTMTPIDFEAHLNIPTDLTETFLVSLDMDGVTLTKYDKPFNVKTKYESEEILSPLVGSLEIGLPNKESKKFTITGHIDGVHEDNIEIKTEIGKIKVEEDVYTDLVTKNTIEKILNALDVSVVFDYATEGRYALDVDFGGFGFVQNEYLADVQMKGECSALSAFGFNAAYDQTESGIKKVTASLEDDAVYTETKVGKNGVTERIEKKGYDAVDFAVTVDTENVDKVNVDLGKFVYSENIQKYGEAKKALYESADRAYTLEAIAFEVSHDRTQENKNAFAVKLDPITYNTLDKIYCVPTDSLVNQKDESFSMQKIDWKVGIDTSKKFTVTTSLDTFGYVSEKKAYKEDKATDVVLKQESFTLNPIDVSIVHDASEEDKTTFDADIAAFGYHAVEKEYNADEDRLETKKDDTFGMNAIDLSVSFGQKDSKTDVGVTLGAFGYTTVEKAFDEEELIDIAEKDDAFSLNAVELGVTFDQSTADKTVLAITFNGLNYNTVEKEYDEESKGYIHKKDNTFTLNPVGLTATFDQSTADKTELTIALDAFGYGIVEKEYDADGKIYVNKKNDSFSMDAVTLDADFDKSVADITKLTVTMNEFTVTESEKEYSADATAEISKKDDAFTLEAIDFTVLLDQSTEKKTAFETVLKKTGFTKVEKEYNDTEKKDVTKKDTSIGVEDISVKVDIVDTENDVRTFDVNVSKLVYSSEKKKYDEDAKATVLSRKLERSLEAYELKGTIDRKVAGKTDVDVTLGAVTYANVKTNPNCVHYTNLALSALNVHTIVSLPADEFIDYNLYFSIGAFQASYDTDERIGKKESISVKFNGGYADLTFEMPTEEDNTYGAIAVIKALDEKQTSLVMNIDIDFQVEGIHFEPIELAYKNRTERDYLTLPVMDEDGNFVDGKNKIIFTGAKNEIYRGIWTVTLPTETDKGYGYNYKKNVKEADKEGKTVYVMKDETNIFLHLATEENNYYAVDVLYGEYDFDGTLEMATEETGRYYLYGHNGEKLIGSVELILPTEDDLLYSFTVSRGKPVEVKDKESEESKIVYEEETAFKVSFHNANEKYNYYAVSLYTYNILIPGVVLDVPNVNVDATLEMATEETGRYYLYGHKDEALVGSVEVLIPTETNKQYAFTINRGVEKKEPNIPLAKEDKKPEYVEEVIFHVSLHLPTDENNFYEASLAWAGFQVQQITVPDFDFGAVLELTSDTQNYYKLSLTYNKALVGTVKVTVPNETLEDYGLTVCKGVSKEVEKVLTYEEEEIFAFFFHVAADETDYYSGRLFIDAFSVTETISFSGIEITLEGETVEKAKGYKVSLIYAEELVGTAVVTVPTAEDKQYGLLVNKAVKKTVAEKTTYEEELIFDVSFHLATEENNYYDVNVIVTAATIGEEGNEINIPEIKANVTLKMATEENNVYAFDVDYNGKKIVAATYQKGDVLLNIEVLDASYVFRYDELDNTVLSFTMPEYVFVIDRAQEKNLGHDVGENTANGHWYFQVSENKKDAKLIWNIGYEYEFEDVFDENGFVSTDMALNAFILYNGAGAELVAGQELDFQAEEKIIEKVDTFFESLESKDE